MVDIRTVREHLIGNGHRGALDRGFLKVQKVKNPLFNAVELQFRKGAPISAYNKIVEDLRGSFRLLSPTESSVLSPDVKSVYITDQRAVL